MAFLRALSSSLGAVPSCQKLALATLLATGATAHTWIEQMQVIGSNGSYVGDYGYPRGYVERNGSPEYGFANKWQLPIPDASSEGRIHINGSDMACHPAQRTANYTADFPMLNVNPGSWVAMKYYENGHVTQPWIPGGKPAAGGTVWVYGTTEPSSSEKLADVLQWTADGKGGNGKGFLMATNNYDDGRCHQMSGYPISINRQMEFPNRVPGQPTSNIEQLCETDLHVPESAKVGSPLTAYWVWSWQTSDHTEGAPCGKDEYYTTCLELNVVAGTEESLAAAPKVHTIGQQDPQPTAVSTYKSRTAIASKPNLITTQACSITAVTSSVIPASLTEITSLPSTSIASTPATATPTYATPAPPAVSSASQASPATSSSTSSASTSTITSTMLSATSSAQSSSSTSTSTSASSSTASSSASSTPGIGFSTWTIYRTGASTSTDSSASAVTPVVSTDGIVREVQNGSHARYARAIGHGRHFAI